MPDPIFQEKNKPKRVAWANPYDGQPINNQDGSINIGNSLVKSQYDYLDLTYTGVNLTQVVYKQGGATGTLVATVDITYDGSDRIKTVLVTTP